MAGRRGEAKDRPLGPRALRTRRRLLDATAELLRERGLRGVSVVEIARRARTSPASFYQYFTGVEQATLELADEAAGGMSEIARLLERPWDGPAGLANARALVARFLDLWDAHHAALRTRNQVLELSQFGHIRGDGHDLHALRRHVTAHLLQAFGRTCCDGEVHAFVRQRVGYEDTKPA